MPCEVEGCDRKHYARGWCRLHYDRWLRTGSVADRVPGYSAAHLRMSKADPAANHPCVDCRGPAKQWSYIGGDPSEIVDAKGWRYSLDKAYYVPRCVRCHLVHDFKPKFSVEQIEEIVRGLANGEAQSKIAERVGCSQSYVSLIKMNPLQNATPPTKEEGES